MSNLGTKIKRNIYKIKRYLFTPIFKFNRLEFNLIGICFIFVGMIVGGIGIVPRIFALNETQYIIAQGGNTDFSTGTPVNVSASSTNISLAKNTGWYSLNWNYKKTLTIKNTSTATLNANSAMSITIDTSSLESVLANCNDLRVIYQGTTELPLTISREPGSTNCNDSKATVLTFPIQANLTTGASDTTNYFLFYGNTGATSQGTNGYSIPGGPVASMVCSFKSSTTCETGQTPTTESGAIRYSGTKSGLSFDEQNDYLTLGGNNTPATSTYELWFYPKKFGTSMGAWQRLLDSPTTVLATSGSGTSGNLVLRLISCSGDVTGGSLTSNNWYHIALSYDGSVYKVFLNGQLVTSKNCSTNTTYDNTSKIGFYGSDPIIGTIDEVRVSDIARYTSNFTPSTSSFVNDTNTKILYHFDENGDDPRNTGKAIDASGNGNHGTISGAKYVSGIVGVDKDSNDTGKLSNQSYASHSGVFIEEGTTNLVTNPSFENGTYNTNWSSNYMNYATASATFTPNMSKRNSAGPFAAGPMVQGKLDSSGTTDSLTVTRGTSINYDFYSNFDADSGSISFWITPEWNGNDGLNHYILSDSDDRILLLKSSTNNMVWCYESSGCFQTSSIDVSAWVTGSTHLIIVRWGKTYTIAGSINYASLTIDDGTPIFSLTTERYNFTPGATLTIGSYRTNVSPINAIIEGFTIYRRQLYDGVYGINVGNGDEMNLIYNSGTGKDPTLITGSWDVVFALPTNASTGSLTTGTGNAWSHPHSSNLLYTSTTNTGGFMLNGDMGSDGYLNTGTTSPADTNSIEFNGTNTSIDAGSNVAVDDLLNSAATIEGWYRVSANSTDNFISKGGGAGPGWELIVVPGVGVQVRVFLTSGYASVSSGIGNWSTDGKWHHVALTFNNLGDRQLRLWIDGNLVDTSAAISDTLLSDSSTNLQIGTGGYGPMGGSVGWSRISNIVRYSSNFTPSTRWTPPGTDANTVTQWNMTDGTGTNVTNIGTCGGTSSNCNGTLSNGSWNKGGALSKSEKVYGGGYKYTSTGSNQGIYRTFTATNGGDYVLRALGNSDGTCNPQIKVTRADGTTEISHLNGTTTSTRGSPDVYIFTWKSPAAESNQVQLINTASSGTCYWHQVEVLSNGFPNPSLETGTGDPWIPTGWNNSGLIAGEGIQENSIVHSGTSSLKIVTSGSGKGINFDVPDATGSFKMFGGFVYTVSGSGGNLRNGSAHAMQHGDNAFEETVSTTATWEHPYMVIRRRTSGAGTTLALQEHTSTNVLYFDDIYLTSLDPVSLTLTPANQTNSTETSGLRVDGLDTLTQPITGLTTTSGVIKFKFTPRYSSTLSNKFGTGNPYLLLATGDGSNYILIYTTTTNIYYRQVAGGVTVAGTTSSYSFTGGTTYNIEASYVTGGNLVLKVDGVNWITQPGALTFTTLPVTACFAGECWGGEKYDATYSNFTTSTITQNTTSPYMKFGSNSVKLVNGGTLGDEYTTSLNVGNTNAHILSAYVYDGTTGNVGGNVSSSIAELYFNNTTISTTYTDMGGGWWRLTGSLTGVNQSALYGVQVKAGKTIYVDGVQLEQKTYSTSYADGSLGNGYSWSGTANNSSSNRTSASLTYSPTNNIDPDKGTISFWFKPSFSTVTIRYSLFNTNSNYYSDNINIAAVPTGMWLRVRQDSPSIVANSNTFNYSWVNNNWYYITATYQDNGNLSIYVNNSLLGSIAMLNGYVPQGIYPGNGALPSEGGGNAQGPISDFRIYNQILTNNQISDLYYQGLGLHSQSVTDDKKYQSTGTWESPVINLGQAGQWGASTNFDTVETLNGNTVGYETKTSNDGNTWSAYSSVTGSGGGYDIQSSPNKYIQIKTTLNSSTQTTTPVVSSEIVNYVQDAEAPITNGVNTLMKINSLGRTVPETGWTNDLSPYFQWDLAEDNVGGSGIKGYCLNLSQTPGENPATTKGLLGTSPVSTTGSTCQFIVGTNNISFDDISLRGNTWLSASTDLYYLSIKAIDNTGNIFPTSEVFDFKFDDIPPTNVTSFSTPQNSFANVDDIYFNWPANGNGTASDSTSGLLGYQFAINNETTWLGDTHENTLNIDYIPLNFAQPFYLDAIRDGSYFQIGNNTVYLRAIDIAGNKASISRTALVSYGGNAPSFSNGSVLSITPSTNTSNMYSVSWPAATPANGRTVTKYYYMINTTPPATLSTMLNNSSIYIETTNLSIPNGPLTGAIKGSNTIYVVAVDDLNNYSPSNALSASFTLDSTLPDPVKNLSISDASVKSASLWRVSLAWEEPDYKGTGVLTYKIQRSTDNSTWSDVSTTTGNAYVDTVNESKRYYWRVGSMDTTNASIASPSYALSVSLIPKGSYTSEAPLVSGPTTSDITTRRANISWVTGRTADSRVTYGIKSGEYFNDETANSRQVTNHVVTLTNLLPATTYFYKARWTDEDGNLGESNEQSFTTSDAPSIKDVQVKSVGINFAQIKFTSKGSTKVKIYYGKTALFGGVTEVSTSTNESTYTVILEGLDDGTKYYYRINPYDIEDTEYEGTVLDLKTYPKPKIYTVNLQQIRNTAETSIQVSWISNTDISSLVTYYPEGKVEQSRDEVNLNLVSGEHKITLKGLLPDTKYVLVVKGLDRIGNEAKSDPQTFTTATDTRAPKISEVLVETYPGEVDNGSGKKNSQIIVSWKTDEPATSKVEYGEGNTDIYEFKTPEDDNLKLNHVVIINNLDISKIYHLRAISLDKAKNESKSQDVVTITAKTQDNAFDLIFKNIRNIFNF